MHSRWVELECIRGVGVAVVQGVLLCIVYLKGTPLEGGAGEIPRAILSRVLWDECGVSILLKPNV